MTLTPDQWYALLALRAPIFGALSVGPPSLVTPCCSPILCLFVFPYACSSPFAVSELGCVCLVRRAKLLGFILNDLNGQDMEAKIAAVKLFEHMPPSLIVDFFSSGVDLLALGRSLPKAVNPSAAEVELHVQLRCAALQSVSTLLLHRTDGLHSMKSFCLAGWSLLSDRILYDPSRRAFTVALEAVSTLCAVLYRNSRHRANDAGIPTKYSTSSASDASFSDGSSGDSGRSHQAFQSVVVEPEVAPLTPGTAAATYAALGGFSPRSASNIQNLSVVSKSASSLEKFGHIVFVKILPHIYSFVNRCRWLDTADLPPALLLLSCLLRQLEPLTGEHSNIQVHFMTSPKHVIGEVVETFLFPLLYSKDEALVFEAASNLIYITQADANMNPGWVLAACRALTGLLSRDSARSVIRRIMPVLITALRLLSPGVLLPVLILALQHIYKLQLSSAHRVAAFYSLVQIPIQLCEQGSLEPVAFFSAFFKHTWIQSIIPNVEENHFREDLMGTIMKSVWEHWNALVQANSHVSSLSDARDHGKSKHDSDSESSSTTATNQSSRSKRLSSSFQQPQSSLFSSSSTSNSHNAGGSAIGQSADYISPRTITTMSAASAVKRLRQWRDVLYLIVMNLTKLLQWRTHVRTYCYVTYLYLVDTVGQALARSKHSKPQMRELLTKVLDSALSLKSDPVCLRFCYVIMKHASDIGNNKLVDTLYKATQQRFLAFLDVTGSTTTDRSLGYRVDQLCKTNLSPADMEVLVQLLHMLSKHPAISDPIADDEKGSAPLDNPRLAATLHYIESIIKYKHDDPVSVHRYAKLSQVDTSHNLAHLSATLTSKLPPSSYLPHGGGSNANNNNSSPNGSVSPTSLHNNVDSSSSHTESSDLAQHINNNSGTQTASGSKKSARGGDRESRRLATIASPPPSCLDGAKTYVPPIEYLSKEAADKHPDDEFLIVYSKSKLPPLSAIDSMRQMDRPTNLSSPSDPFVVEAYHLINIEFARITFYLRITNLTNFQVPKTLLFVDIKGRLEPFNAQVGTHATFLKMEPGETALWHTAFKLNSTHVNEMMVRLHLVPQAEKPSLTLEVQCMPYRINMHVMTLPWVIQYSDYTREWGRYTNSVSFKLLLDHSVSLQHLNDSISGSYYCQISWSYNDTYQSCFSGITAWDERVLFSVFAARDDSQSQYQIKIELRTSSPTLSVIVDNNKDDWLRDLLPLLPNWFTFASDRITSDSLFGISLFGDFGIGSLGSGAISSASAHTSGGGALTSSALDEKLLLDQWNKTRAS